MKRRLAVDVRNERDAIDQFAASLVAIDTSAHHSVTGTPRVGASLGAGLDIAAHGGDKGVHALVAVHPRPREQQPAHIDRIAVRGDAEEGARAALLKHGDQRLDGGDLPLGQRESDRLRPRANNMERSTKRESDVKSSETDAAD